MNRANYTVTGRVHVKGEIIPIQTKKGELLKRSLVLEVPVSKGMWDRTNFACFETFNERVHQLEEYEVGDDVEIEFTIKSNQGKKDPTQWFTSLYIQNIYREWIKTEEREEPKEKQESSELEDPFAVKEEMPDTLLDERYNHLIEKPEKPKDLFDMDEWPDKPDNIQPLPF